jgi:hypothetical protein
MDLPVVGAAWPEEHEDLAYMAQVLAVALHIQGLREPAAGLPLRQPPGRQRSLADAGEALSSTRR